MGKFFIKLWFNSINKSLSLTNNSLKKAKAILVREQNGIVNAAFILMILVLITKFTGLIFNSIAVGFLGTAPFNEFLFASNLPEIISASILLGAISASVIPALIDAREEGGHERFLSVLNTLVNLSLLTFIIIAVIIAITAHIFMPWMIDNVIKPVTPPTQKEMDEIVMMLRILMIPQVILGVSAFVSSSLNVMQRFVVPQLAPLFYNIGRIFAVLVFIPILGKSPWVLVWGTLIGSILHLLIQLPLARHLNISYQFSVNIKDKYFKNILKLGMPRVIGLSAEQIGIGVDRLIAYSLVSYSLAAYELAVKLIVIPISLFGSTFAIAAFPTLSRAYTKNDKELFKNTFLKVVNQILFLSLPATVLLMVLRLPLTRLFYGLIGKSFTWDDTKKVAWVVMFFAIGLSFEALRSLIYRSYYAIHNSIIPLVSAFLVVFSGITTGILFTNYLSHFEELSIMHLSWHPEYFLSKADGMAGVGGLALSASLIYITESLILILLLNKRYLQLKIKEVYYPILKKILIATITAIFSYVLYKLYTNVSATNHIWQVLLLTAINVFLSLGFYVILSYVMKIEEIFLLKKFYCKFLKLKCLGKNRLD